MYFAIKDYLEERQQINTKNPYLFVSEGSVNVLFTELFFLSNKLINSRLVSSNKFKKHKY